MFDIYAEESQLAHDIVVCRARLLQRCGRDGKLGVCDQALLLGHRAVGNEIAGSARIGFGLRERGLPLPNVGLSLQKCRLQLGDIRGFERQQYLAFAYPIAQRHIDLSNAARDGHGQARQARRHRLHLAGSLEFVNRENCARDLGDSDALELRRSRVEAHDLPERVGAVVAFEAGGSVPDDVHAAATATHDATIDSLMAPRPLPPPLVPGTHCARTPRALRSTPASSR